MPGDRQSEQEAKARPPRSAARIRQRRAWGWGLQVLGGAAIGAGVLSGALAFTAIRNPSSPLRQQGWLATVFEIVVMTVLLGAGRWAVRQGSRHQAAVLDTLETLPAEEEIVLFLRAFADDEGFAHVPEGPAKYPWAARLQTEEQQMAGAVAPFGVMIALGKPDDTLPQVGADRHYASDQSWQTQVLAALDRAGLVLLAAGPGPSLRWEVEQVVARDRPERLVLIGVRDAEQYESFRAATQLLFPKGLPLYPAPPIVRVMDPPAHYIHSVIWFDADWTPHLTVLGQPDPEVHAHRLVRLSAWVKTAFPLAIRQVYQRAGLPVPGLPATPRARPWAVNASVALFALIIGSIAAIFWNGENFKALLLIIPFGVLLYRVWRGGWYLTKLVKFLGGILGGAFGLLLVILHDPSPRTLVAAPLVAALLGGVLLLTRRDVNDWIASKAWKKAPDPDEAEHPR